MGELKAPESNHLYLSDDGNNHHLNQDINSMCSTPYINVAMADWLLLQCIGQSNALCIVEPSTFVF